jgi:hypothetical protein
MAGETDTNDEVVEEAVLLLDLRLNTELLRPEYCRPRCSGEGIPAWEDASKFCETQTSEVEAEVEGRVLKDSIEDWLGSGKSLFLLNKNMAWLSSASPAGAP